MNTKIILLLLALTAVISCTDATRKRLIGKKQAEYMMYQVQPICPTGTHWQNKHSNSNLSSWGNITGKCMDNDSGCDEFEQTTGNCKKCKWGYGKKADDAQGNHCEVRWWYILMIVGAIIAGLVIFGPVICCIISCCVC